VITIERRLPWPWTAWWTWPWCSRGAAWPLSQISRTRTAGAGPRCTRRAGEAYPAGRSCAAQCEWYPRPHERQRCAYPPTGRPSWVSMHEAHLRS
jgi:hypothetical protein